MPGELITIGSYTTAIEANLVKSLLEAFGIQAVLADHHSINANWSLSHALGGVKVRVLESDAEAARELIRPEADWHDDQESD